MFIELPSFHTKSVKKKDPFADKADLANLVVEISAEMIALGFQLAEEHSDDKAE